MTNLVTHTGTVHAARNGKALCAGNVGHFASETNGKVTCKRCLSRIPAQKANPLRCYTVRAYDEDGFPIAESDGVMTIENAECARAFMRSEFRPALVIVSDEFGYTY